MKSLPSPPSSMSAPLPPRIVSLPAPPSTVSSISAARLPAAMNVSSPPLVLRTRFSVVPMSMANGAGSTRSKRTRVPLAVMRERLGAVAAVDFGGVVAGAALDQIGVVAGIPDHAVVAGLAEHLVVAVAAGQRVVAGAAEQQVGAALAEQRVVAGLAEQLVVARTAGQHVVAGAAEQVGPGSAPLASLSVMVSLPPWPNDLDQAGVGDRRRAARESRTAPPLTRIVPAASRLTVIVLSRPSPKTVSLPAAEEKQAVTASS